MKLRIMHPSINFTNTFVWLSILAISIVIWANLIKLLF